MTKEEILNVYKNVGITPVFGATNKMLIHDLLSKSKRLINRWQSDYAYDKQNTVMINKLSPKKFKERCENAFERNTEEFYSAMDPKGFHCLVFYHTKSGEYELSHAYERSNKNLYLRRYDGNLGSMLYEGNSIKDLIVFDAHIVFEYNEYVKLIKKDLEVQGLYISQIENYIMANRIDEILQNPSLIAPHLLINDVISVSNIQFRDRVLRECLPKIKNLGIKFLNIPLSVEINKRVPGFISVAEQHIKSISPNLCTDNFYGYRLMLNEPFFSTILVKDRFKNYEGNNR